MKKLLRKLLGLDDDRKMILDHIWRCEYELLEAEERQIRCNHEISVHNQAVARLIAKLEPNFAKDELDPSRRAESDKLADEVLHRLSAEQAARDKHNFPRRD